MKEDRPLRCPKCNTLLRRSPEGELKCYTCGYERSTASERAKFYKLHKDAILHDLDKLGLIAMRAKWGIPYSSWSQLRKRWELRG